MLGELRLSFAGSVSQVSVKSEGSPLPMSQLVSNRVLPRIMGISAESGGASGSKGSPLKRPSFTGP